MRKLYRAAVLTAALGLALPAAAAPGTDAMMKDMAAVPMTGDADRDFAAMMIPHHQGAIDMARQELAHGRDPAMQKMARAIIAAQESEIATLKAWLAKHPAQSQHSAH